MSSTPSDDEVLRRFLPESPSEDAPRETERIARKAKFVLQRVVSRKFVGFRPNPKSTPEKILYYVVESLECGHKMPVYPVEGETFTAKKRSCHECLNELIKWLEPKPSRALHGAALLCLALVGFLLVIALPR